jgi:hypothetical protein
LAANGEGVVPTVRMEHAGHQRSAQHITYGLTRHANTQGLHLLTRDKIALHDFWFVNEVA